jgi:SecA DEAD-like domain
VLAEIAAAVHVLTFNDYLARRDAAWMGPVYRGLGLEVACRARGAPSRVINTFPLTGNTFPLIGTGSF